MSLTTGSTRAYAQHAASQGAGVSVGQVSTVSNLRNVCLSLLMTNTFHSVRHTVQCKSLEPPLFSLYAASEKPKPFAVFQVALNNIENDKVSLTYNCIFNSDSICCTLS